MPTKAIPFVIVALVAAGYAVYQNREHFLEIMDRGRRRIKEFAEKVAEDLERARTRELERPHNASRLHPSNDRRLDYFDDAAAAAALRKEDEAHPHALSVAVASSGHLRRASIDGFRQRSSAIGDYEKQTSFQNDVQSSVLFDASPHPKEHRFPLESLSRSRRSSSTTISGTLFNEKEPLLQPPLPTRRAKQQAKPFEENVGFNPSDDATNAAVLCDATRDTVATAPTSSTPPPPVANIPPLVAAVSPSSHKGPQVTQTSSTSTTSPSESQTLPPCQSNPHWSIHEWQQGIFSPSSSTPPASPSLAGSAAEVVDDDNLDVISEFGGSEGGSSEAGWTEVGSSISGDN